MLVLIFLQVFVYGQTTTTISDPSQQLNGISVALVGIISASVIVVTMIFVATALLIFRRRMQEDAWKDVLQDAAASHGNILSSNPSLVQDPVATALIPLQHEQQVIQPAFLPGVTRPQFISTTVVFAGEGAANTTISPEMKMQPSISRTNMVMSESRIHLSASGSNININTLNTGLSWSQVQNQLNEKASNVSAVSIDILPTKPEELDTMVDKQSPPLAVPAYLEMIKDDIKVGKQIGKGGSAILYLARIRSDIKVNQMSPTEKQIAVKVLKNVDSFKKERQKSIFQQEVAIMNHFTGHPNFVKLYGFLYEPLTIVMKYYSHGSMSAFVEKKSDIPIEKWARDYAFGFALDILNALSELHKAQIIHNDLKPANALIDKVGEGYVAVLCDFSIATISGKTLMGVKEFKATKVKGASIPYASPETIRKLYHDSISQMRVEPLGTSTSQTFKLDMYSFAIMMFEVINRTRAWVDASADSKIIIKGVLEGERPIWSKDIKRLQKKGGKNEYCMQLVGGLEDCWQEDSHKRPNAEELYRSLLKYAT